MKLRLGIFPYLLISALPALAFGAGTEIMPVKDIKPGMKGYGLTVFQGTTPEKFEFEVIGILPNYKPHYDVILVRNSHPILAQTGNFHGMSGSPMYIEGKLIGAFGLGFSEFPKDVIGGVTPIEVMIEDGKRQANPQRANEFSSPEKPATKPSKAGQSLQPAKMTFSVSGFSDRSFAFARDYFDREFGFDLEAGGNGGTDATDTRTDLQPGDAFEVQMMRGDMKMGGTGTVTYRDGNRFLAFGHPLQEFGDIEFPVATAKVLVVLGSLSSSHWMAIGGNEIGALTVDRKSCVAGELGKKAAMTPIAIRVKNIQTGATEEVRCEMIRHKRLSPGLFSIALFNAIDNAESSALAATSTVNLKIWLEGRAEPIVLKDVYANNSGPLDFMMPYPVNLLASNPFATVQFARIEADVTVSHERLTADIEGASLDVNEVKPGDKVNLTVVVRPFGKEPERITVPITIPANLPEESYDIEVGGGSQTEPDAAPPKNVEDIIRLLEARYQASDLVTVMELGTIGTRQEGKALRKLPFSVFGTLYASSSAGIAVAPDTLRIVTPTKYVLNGKKALKIKVSDKGGS